MMTEPQSTPGATSTAVAEAPALELVHVSLAFDEKVVLRDVSFTLRRGHTKIILGASGSGKSTSLKIITGLLRADGGVVWVNGQRVERVLLRDGDAIEVGRRDATAHRRLQLVVRPLDEERRNDDDQFGFRAEVGVGLEQRAEHRHITQPGELDDVLLRARLQQAGDREALPRPRPAPA